MVFVLFCIIPTHTGVGFLFSFFLFFSHGACSVLSYELLACWVGWTRTYYQARSTNEAMHKPLLRATSNIHVDLLLSSRLAAVSKVVQSE